MVIPFGHPRETLGTLLGILGKQWEVSLGILGKPSAFLGKQ